jgi:hypothetical protein
MSEIILRWSISAMKLNVVNKIGNRWEVKVFFLGSERLRYRSMGLANLIIQIQLHCLV